MSEGPQVAEPAVAVPERCTETLGGTLGSGDTEVISSFDDALASERVALTRRQMTQLVFGGHPSCEPLDLPEKAGDLLNQVFPFYFPICCIAQSAPRTPSSGTRNSREDTWICLSGLSASL